MPLILQQRIVRSCVVSLCLNNDYICYTVVIVVASIRLPLFACLLVRHRVRFVYEEPNALQDDAECSLSVLRSVSEKLLRKVVISVYAYASSCDSRGGDKYKKMLIMIFLFSLFTEDRRFDSHNLKMVMAIGNFLLHLYRNRFSSGVG